MSWHFPGTGWRCGMQKGNYNNLQRVAMYFGVSTTTTTTTTTLVQTHLVTWVLPEKISWKIFQGKKVVCKGANYEKWYSKIPTGCRLKKGKYSIECASQKSTIVQKVFVERREVRTSFHTEMSLRRLWD